MIAKIKSIFGYDDHWHFFTEETKNTSQIVLKLNNTNYDYNDKRAIFTDLKAQIL